MRLNIGAGGDTEEGWEPWDISHGRDCRDMAALASGTVDEIRASHVLEHIGLRETLPTLREWRRVLKPGGRLFVAVPDFKKIVGTWMQDEPHPHLEMYLMGGQSDEHDFHKAVFWFEKLAAQMEAAGFDRVGRCGPAGASWNCSHLPVSLNVEGFANGEESNASGAD